MAVVVKDPVTGKITLKNVKRALPKGVGEYQAHQRCEFGGRTCDGYYCALEVFKADVTNPRDLPCGTSKCDLIAPPAPVS